MMNAADWQATAEVLVVIFAILNGLGGFFVYRMSANFVTRGEHRVMEKRVDEIDGKIGAMDKTIGSLFTNDKAQALTDKLTAVQIQSAALIAQIPALESAITKLSHQTNLLIENELGQKGRDR